MPKQMMFLQTQLNETAQLAYGSINFATGCIVVIVALSTTVVFLYRRTETLQKEFREYLQSSNETMLKVHQSVNLSISQVTKVMEYIESKK